jgi:RNA polymerase sigma factor (sigma-70 family)
VAEYYRRRSRKKETMQVDLVYAERRSDQSNTTSMEDRIALFTALNQLPKQYCEVIILRFAEGLQFNEIAKLLKKNPEAIKSLFRRALSALREKMEVKDEQTSK